MKKYSLFLFPVLLGACNVPPPIENAVESMKKIMGMAVATPSPKASPVLSAEVSATKANAELLAEMFQVTFNRKEMDDALFASLVSSLNQGASFEGIYRGLVMGSQYRVLESKSKASSPEAIKFFAMEMSDLQKGMKNPTLFTKDTAKQVPSIEYPEGASDTPDSYTFGDEPMKESQPKKTQSSLSEELMQDFIGATPYTLKRVLGEEALKKMDELKDSPADLSQWYAGLVVHLSEEHTDFGLPQRNTADFDFHSRFAKTMSLDRVKWEVLNRYHRVINRLN